MNVFNVMENIRKLLKRYDYFMFKEVMVKQLERIYEIYIFNVLNSIIIVRFQMWKHFTFLLFWLLVFSAFSSLQPSAQISGLISGKRIEDCDSD